jgi:hypothetical protein
MPPKRELVISINLEQKLAVNEYKGVCGSIYIHIVGGEGGGSTAPSGG